MAAPIVSLSFFALLVIATVALIVVLGVFKLIAWAGNSMLGRSHVVHSGSGGLRLWPVVAGVVPICLIVLSLLLVKVRTVQSVQVNSADSPLPEPIIHFDDSQVTIVQDGTAVALEDLTEAQREIMQVIQEHGGQIPVDLPAEVPAPSSKPAIEPTLTTFEPVAQVASADNAESSNVAESDTTTQQAAVDTVATTTPPAEVAAETPATENAGEQKTSPDETAAVETAAPTSDVTEAAAIPPTNPVAETPEQRQARLTELASHISPWIRSLLKETQPEDATAPNDVAEAVESSDKQIVVFQLAGPIRQKYALIPLTPAFDAAMSPVTPFLANGSLESIAESLATFLKQPADAATEVSAAAPGAADTALPQPVGSTNASTPPAVAMAESTSVGSVNAGLSPGEQLPDAVVEDVTPEWVENPQPHQFVVRSEALFPEESTVAPLNKAINKVLAEHLKLDEDSLAPALRAQAQLVKLELDEKTTQACVIKTFERLQAVGNGGTDKQNMRFVYALVELPESVRKAAVQTVRVSLQRDRVTGLAVIVGLAWLAIFAAGVVVRLWGRGGFFRKMIAIPILCLICIPLLLLAIGTGAATAGIPGSKMPRYPWADSSKPIRIQL